MFYLLPWFLKGYSKDNKLCGSYRLEKVNVAFLGWDEITFILEKDLKEQHYQFVRAYNSLKVFIA